MYLLRFLFVCDESVDLACSRRREMGLVVEQAALPAVSRPTDRAAELCTIQVGISLPYMVHQCRQTYNCVTGSSLLAFLIDFSINYEQFRTLRPHKTIYTSVDSLSFYILLPSLLPSRLRAVLMTRSLASLLSRPTAQLFSDSATTLFPVWENLLEKQRCVSSYGVVGGGGGGTLFCLFMDIDFKDDFRWISCLARSKGISVVHV